MIVPKHLIKPRHKKSEPETIEIIEEPKKRRSRKIEPDYLITDEDDGVTCH